MNMTIETGMCSMYKVYHCLMYYLGLALEEVISLVIQMSFTITSSVHEWMSRFKFIRLYSIEDDFY